MKKIIFVLAIVMNVAVIAGLVQANEVPPVTCFPQEIMPEYVIQEADYKGKIENDMAFVDVKLKIEVLGKGQVKVPVFNKEVALMKSNLPKGVLLLQENGWYKLLFSKKGNYSIGLQLASMVGHKDDRNILKLKINPASISKLNLAFEGTDLDIKNHSAMSTQVRTKGKQTEFTAYLGAAEDVYISWFAKPTSLAKAELLFNSVNSSLITISQGIVNTKTFLNYEIIQGKLTRFDVSLPQDMNLLTVKGENLKNWNMRKEKGKQILSVELTREIADSYYLVLESEELKEKVDSQYTYTASNIVSLNTDRESGFYAVVVREDLKISQIKKRKGLSQLDVSELPKHLKKSAGGAEKISFAYRFLRKERELALAIEKIKPEITVRNNIFLQVTEELMKLIVQADYKITKAGVFNFTVELPNDMEVIDVNGVNIENWKVEGVDQSVKLLNVQLRSKAIGEYKLKISMERPVKDVYKDIEMPHVRITNVDKVAGFIGISAESSIRLKTKQRSKLTEIGLYELVNPPTGIVLSPILAYKFMVQPYELALAVEKVDSRLVADVFTFVSVGEGLMLVNTAVNFDILFAGVDSFKIALPANVDAVDITGMGIKAKDEKEEKRVINGNTQNIKVYTISLHSKVKGKYTLYCSYEKVSKKSSQQTTVPSLEVLNVERQSGHIAIGPRTNVEIEISDVQGLSQVDVKELPQDKTASIDIPILHALKYVRYPYSATLDVKKHEDVSVLVAVVESASITTVMGKDGQVIVSAVYNIKNRSKQYLDIKLPKGASIWSTFVDGKAVKPAKTEEGKILLPLTKNEGKDRSFPVEIVYETKGPRFFLFGGLKLTSPVFDIPLTNVTWNVYLPFGYNYHNLGGNLQKGRIAFVHTQSKVGRDAQTIMPSIAPMESAKRERVKKRKMRREYKEARLAEEEIAGGFVGDKLDYEMDDAAYPSAQAPQKDMNFVSNISQQIARYNKQLEPQGKREITQGRQKGVLPIHITIPTGGRLFVFSKLISREPLKVRAMYSKRMSKLSNLIFILLIIIAVVKRETLKPHAIALVAKAKQYLAKKGNDQTQDKDEHNADNSQS